MSESSGSRNKADILREHGALNPHPEKVQSQFFDHDFFDPRDMMQVKYEMLRAVQHDRQSVTEAADAFGLTRPVFYRAKEDYERAGIPGLASEKRGPKAPRKLSSAMLDFIHRQKSENKGLSSQELHDRLESEFDVKVHTRTVQRALKRLEKKGSRS